MKHEDLVREIRVHRRDSDLASSRVAALDSRIRDESNDVVRLMALANEAQGRRDALVAEQEDEQEVALYAARCSESLGVLLVNLAVGEIDEADLLPLVERARDRAATEAAEAAEAAEPTLDDCEILDGGDLDE